MNGRTPGSSPRWAQDKKGIGYRSTRSGGSSSSWIKERPTGLGQLIAHHGAPVRAPGPPLDPDGDFGATARGGPSRLALNRSPGWNLHRLEEKGKRVPARGQSSADMSGLMFSSLARTGPSLALGVAGARVAALGAGPVKLAVTALGPPLPPLDFNSGSPWSHGREGSGGFGWSAGGEGLRLYPGERRWKIPSPPRSIVTGRRDRSVGESRCSSWAATEGVASGAEWRSLGQLPRRGLGTGFGRCLATGARRSCRPTRPKF